MVHDNQPNPLQDTLLAPGPRYFEKTIGYVCVMVTAGLVAFGTFLLLSMFRGNGKPLGLAALLVCTAVLICFFATVGHRLVLNRPNTFGSIASPATWFVCFAVFCAFTLLFIATAITRRDLGLAQGATVSALLALLAFGAATHFRRRK